MNRHRAKAAAKLEHDVILLIGLLYHGTSQNDALVMRNIFKDGLERAEAIHRKLRTTFHLGQDR